VEPPARNTWGDAPLEKRASTKGRGHQGGGEARRLILKRFPSSQKHAGTKDQRRKRTLEGSDCKKEGRHERSKSQREEATLHCKSQQGVGIYRRRGGNTCRTAPLKQTGKASNRGMENEGRSEGRSRGFPYMLANALTARKKKVKLGVSSKGRAKGRKH